MIRLVLASSVLALSACNGSVPESGAASGQATATTTTSASGTRYDCDTGATLFAKIGGGSATITLDDGTALNLRRVRGVSDTGTTYAADGWVWFVDGDEAVLSEQGGQKNCRVATA